AKIGLATMVAALFVAFAAFGLGSKTTSASPIAPIAVGTGPCTPNSGTPGAALPTSATFATGTVLGLPTNFHNADAPLSHTLSSRTICLLKATEYTSVNVIGTDITNLAVDTDPAASVYGQNQATLSQYPVQPVQLQSLAYDFTTTVSCTTDGDLTIT